MSTLRIRDLRLAQGMTLSELSAAANVSVSMLSQVERGQADPSLETLRHIARVLEVPLFELFTDHPAFSSVSITRHDHRLEISSPDSEVVYGRLSAPGRSLEVLHCKLAPGGASSAAARTHQAEECVVVLNGALEIDFGERTVSLGRGDSAHFDSRVPHRMINTGVVAAEFLISVTPPSH